MGGPREGNLQSLPPLGFSRCRIGERKSHVVNPLALNCSFHFLPLCVLYSLSVYIFVKRKWSNFCRTKSKVQFGGQQVTIFSAC